MPADGYTPEGHSDTANCFSTRSPSEPFHADARWSSHHQPHGHGSRLDEASVRSARPGGTGDAAVAAGARTSTYQSSSSTQALGRHRRRPPQERRPRVSSPSRHTRSWLRLHRLSVFGAGPVRSGPGAAQTSTASALGPICSPRRFQGRSDLSANAGPSQRPAVSWQPAAVESERDPPRDVHHRDRPRRPQHPGRTVGALGRPVMR